MFAAAIFFKDKRPFRQRPLDAPKFVTPIELLSIGPEVSNAPSLGRVVFFPQA